MKRHIIFQKSTGMVNALLLTGLCKNEGRWIITCDDNTDVMKELQKACNKITVGTPYKNYKLTFALEDDYSNLVTA